MKFIDLCKKKNEDRLWMDEIAAMQALPHPDLSYFRTSGIVLAGEDNIASDSSASRGSSDTNAGMFVISEQMFNCYELGYLLNSFSKIFYC